jgi:hypothetical protein
MHRDFHWLERSSYTVHLCERCRLVSQRDIPDEFLAHRLHELRRHNDSANSPSAQTSRAGAANRCTAIFMAAAMAPLKRTALRTLHFGSDIREFPQTATPSGAPMEQTTASHRGIEYHQAQEDQTAWTDSGVSDTFDVIHVGDALERSSDPCSIVTLLARKLRASGVLHVAVRNGAGIHRTLRRFERDLAKSRDRTLHSLMPLEELNCFCPAALMYLAEQCGLERLRPSWKSLLQAYRAAAGDSKALLPAIIRLCSLRGRHSIDLLFRKASSTIPDEDPD